MMQQNHPNAERKKTNIQERNSKSVDRRPPYVFENCWITKLLDIDTVVRDLLVRRIIGSSRAAKAVLQALAVIMQAENSRYDARDDDDDTKAAFGVFSCSAIVRTRNLDTRTKNGESLEDKREFSMFALLNFDNLEKSQRVVVKANNDI
jgi:hypothetical protein